MSPIPDMATSEAPMKDAGSASGLVNTNQQLGFAIGTALVSVIFFGALGGNASDNAREASAQLRQDLAAASVTGQSADRIVDYFVQCTSDQAKERDWTVQAPSCAKVPTEPSSNKSAAQVYADTGKHTNALTFADTFAHSLRWFIGGMVLTLLLTFLAGPVERGARQERGRRGVEGRGGETS
ncbi:hypothetical protein LT493_11920 [Streptomyces tricolor]|nr:hypothetical protein [Streptomyces tricolor]